MKKFMNEIKVCVMGAVFVMAILASFLFFGMRARAASVRDGVHSPVFEDLQEIPRHEIAEMRNAEEWEPEWVCPMTEDEMDLFAAIVYAESADQGFYGMRLVADVILNRIDSNLWPNDIFSVVYQPYQFSPVLDGGLDRAWGRVTQECYEACMMELRGPRIDYNIQYFSMHGCQNGVFAFQYQDHFFGV